MRQLSHHHVGLWLVLVLAVQLAAAPLEQHDIADEVHFPRITSLLGVYVRMNGQNARFSAGSGATSRSIYHPRELGELSCTASTFTLEVANILSHEFGVQLGARVLGARLRAMAQAGGWRPRDLLLLTTCDLDTETRDILQAEGWRVARVEPMSNPFAGIGDTKAKRVFTKLRIWEPRKEWPVYDRLVYLDIDVLPMEAAAVDAMFGCAGSFCATPSSSREVEFGAINTGVIVLQPSAEVFAELELARHGIKGSYNRGDQGFLNVFFGEYCKQPLELRTASAAPEPCKALAKSRHRMPIKWNYFGPDSRPDFNRNFDEWAPGERVNGSQYMNTLTDCHPEAQIQLCEYCMSFAVLLLCISSTP